jgi:hypothetical protein
MLGQNPLIAMKDVDLLVPHQEVEVSLYAAFCHGLGALRELNLDQRTALAAALDTFRGVYHRGWVGGTAFVTHSEMVFIPASAQRSGRPAELAIRVPLIGVLAVEVARSLWRDTLTVRTVKGRFNLRGFMARRFGACLEQACAARLGELSAGGLRPQAA